MEQVGLFGLDKTVEPRDVELQLIELSQWWEIKEKDFKELMINKARANNMSLEEQVDEQYNLYQNEMMVKGATHATKFSLKDPNDATNP